MAKYIRFPKEPFKAFRDRTKKDKKSGLVVKENGQEVFDFRKGDTVPAPGADAPEGQMLSYLQGKYGEEPIDQYELMLDLNAHQGDETVIKDAKERIRPLSQIFSFYIGDWTTKGYVERASLKAIAPTVRPVIRGKVAQLEARIRYLEAQLQGAGVQYDKAA